MKLLLLLLSALTLEAQTVYPGAIDSDASLGVARNKVSARLVGAISSSATSLTIAYNTGSNVFLPNMMASFASSATSFPSEIVWVCGVSGTTVQLGKSSCPNVDGRGLDNTSAAAHVNGEAFENRINAGYFSNLKGAVIALEANSSAAGSVNSSLYNFDAQTPGGSLVALGVNQPFTMTPCPLGVNGTDTDHWLYITGGTGTAEPVLITGGTCTSGATTGTITITPTNAHSGAWTVQSATIGMSEAIWDLDSGVGGKVIVGAGSGTIHAPIKRRPLTPIWIEGQGEQATTLLYASDFPTSGVNGFFDWSPGDTNAVPIGGVSDLTVQCTQPDSTNIALYTHQKPILYSAGTYHTQWRNIAIVACWDGALIPTATNGAYFQNIYGSTFHRLISLDNLFDSPILDNIHHSTTGLTANQGIALLATSTAANTFYIGRTDDLKISNSTSGVNSCLDIHLGSGGTGPSAEITNLWCEGTIGQADGNVRISNLQIALAGAVPVISHTGGNLSINQMWILHTGTATAIVSQPVRQNLGTADGPFFSISNSYILAPASTLYTVFCSTGGALVYAHECKLNGNYFYRAPGVVYANSAVLAEAGVADTRLEAIGNTFFNAGGGTGTAITVTNDSYHVITGNNGGGYGYSLPATKANLTFCHNTNFLGNVCWDAVATKIAARLTVASFAPLQTENYIASETGANNAIAGALLDAAGVAVPQAAGLKVTVKLGHTLQAGANTFALNGAAAAAIKSSRNVANDIGTAYAATGIVTLLFDGTRYLDVSQ